MLVCYSMPWTVHTVNSVEHRSQGIGLPIVVCRRIANVVAIRRVYWAQNIPKTHLQLVARPLPWTHQRKLTMLPWPPSCLWGPLCGRRGGKRKEGKGKKREETEGREGEKEISGRKGKGGKDKKGRNGER